MSILKKVTNAVKKVVDNDVTGWAVNYPAKIAESVAGIKPSKQYEVGAPVAAVAGLLGGSEGGIMSNLLGGDSNTGILGAIFGSGENSLGSILGSVVKGAVGIGADYFSNQQYYKDQTKLNEQKFKYDQQLADQAYQRDVAMWNMQNAYNAPAQQMQRLQQAGLNPNLVYGGGNVTGNTAGSPPSAPRVEYPSSQASKLDLARNVLGIFNEYQCIKNQVLDNQRQSARIALQERALELSEKRLDKQDRDAERRYNVILANLGLAKQKYEDKQPLRKKLKKKVDEVAQKDGRGFFSGLSDGLFWLNWF